MHSYINLAKLLIVCRVPKVLLASMLDVEYPIKDARPKIYVPLHDDVQVISPKELNQIPLQGGDVSDWFAPTLAE